MAVVEILDDAAAIVFLKEIGIFHHIPSPRAFADTCRAATYTKHATHWIVGLRFEGYKNPEDNGYAVRCFPKHQFSLDQVTQNLRQFFVEQASETDPKGPYTDYGTVDL